MTTPSPSAPPPDHWSPTSYALTAPFVPHLTTRLTTLLAPHHTDTLLDLGCGDGLLTAQLSHHCAHILGLDASPSMLAAARQHNSTPTTAYTLLDCRHLLTFAQHPQQQQHYTKLVSNAALHWILRDPATRADVFRGALELLQPGGVFVAELGAAGNVAEVHAALVSALVHRGVGVGAAVAASPWYFATEEGVRGLLRGAGFDVELVETELRQTVLTEVEGGGVEGWVRLFGESFLGAVGEGEREGVVREVVDVLEGVGRREGGEMVVNYVRLSFIPPDPVDTPQTPSPHLTRPVRLDIWHMRLSTYPALTPLPGLGLARVIQSAETSWSERIVLGVGSFGDAHLGPKLYISDTAPNTAYSQNSDTQHLCYAWPVF
ncbi:S-adenosyl-L-methionine-dependent methyltransferase [Morchella snyderi]|nr:S-adenosyl-L-methionine-dependent methyltransferase [Morchella snyderi]